MKLEVDYEYDNKKLNIHEINTIVIPIKSYIVFNDEAYFSIMRLILDYESLHHGVFLLGDPKIKNIKIVYENCL